MKRKYGYKRDRVKHGLDWEEGTPDEENPEWTEKDFKRAKRFDELPLKEQKALLSIQKRGRPRLENPKENITFRLASSLTKRIKAFGKGYNTRVEEILTEAMDSGKL